jgi:hypothetical protein
LQATGKKLPSPHHPYPDSVTSATPMSSFSVQTKLRAPSKNVVIFLELNKSGDNNAAFTKKNNDWVGQPSLIYKTVLPGTNQKQSYKLELIGHGGLLKDKAAIYQDLSKFTTALHQVKKIEVILD